MSSYLETIFSKIEVKNPEHAAKLRKNNKDFGEDYSRMANLFFRKYDTYLKKKNKTLDFGVNCYLHMCADMIDERIKFIKNGKYSSTSFDEVEKRVYGNPEIMIYHMHGLVLAQFLWFDQYYRIDFFCKNLYKYASNAKNYLEIGGGHGLYMNEALVLLPNVKQFDLVDISESSIDLAKGIINDEKVNYYLKNIFDFPDNEAYDFVTMGEVLEHVEDPLALLSKISKLTGKAGICYITTPINSPMIDHIYLFSNEEELRELFNLAGLEILEEKTVISEHITRKMAEKFKVPVMYAAFIKNKIKQ
jgi:2-polyprenyl-3-methyl-5-hydroxy-6-metoxy-1,4-benzoquinol methylase